MLFLRFVLVEVSRRYSRREATPVVKGEDKTTKLRRVTIVTTVLRSHVPCGTAHVARISSARDF